MCDVAYLITDAVARLGKGSSDAMGEGAEMSIRAWDSPVAQQIVISRVRIPEGDEKLTQGEGEKVGAGSSGGAHIETPDLSLVVVFPTLNDLPAEIEFLKKGQFTSHELDAIAHSLILSHNPPNIGERRGGMQSEPSEQNGGPTWRGRREDEKREFRGRERVEDIQREIARERENKMIEDATKKSKRVKALKELKEMGVKVYGGEEEGREEFKASSLTWESLAGYDEQKREIEDTVLLALRKPEIYDYIAHGTRKIFESNRPRAVLFEGPPGTGKTSCARVIASQAGVPLLYVPLEAIASKYYGEAERSLSSVFSAGKNLPSGAIVFLDEVKETSGK